MRANSAQILPDLIAGERLLPPTGLLDIVSAGRNRITSGSAAETSFQVIHGDGSPFWPNALTPPAIPISSGIQWPPDIGGSTHSMKASFFFGRPATLAEMAARRSCIEAISFLPASGRPMASAMRAMSE